MKIRSITLSQIAGWVIVGLVSSVVTKAFAHFDSLKARPPPPRQFKGRRPAKRIVKVCGQLCFEIGKFREFGKPLRAVVAGRPDVKWVSHRISI